MARSKKKLQTRSSTRDCSAHTKDTYGDSVKAWGKNGNSWLPWKTNGGYIGKSKRIAIPRKKHLIMWQCLKFPPPVFKAQAAHPLPAPFSFPTPFRKARYLKIAGFAERCFFFCRKSSRFGTDSNRLAKFILFFKKAAVFLERIRGPPSEV